ncbi:MAG: o-succinylbenzoate synthase [Bacteroidota bacterium]
MIVKKFEVIPYKLNLKQPFINANSKILYREGYIVEIIDELGNKAYGDISPFPGLSHESFESLSPKTIEIKGVFVDNEIDSDIFNLLSDFPSMRFGISQALHSIYILRNGYDPELKFSPTVLVNGVVGMVPQLQALHQIENLIASGFTTIKIKVGRESIDEDVELIKMILNNFSENIKYRLDANGNWDIDQTKYFINQISGINVEYLEQPVDSLKELIELSNTTDIPIAADESIRNEEDVNRLLEESNIKYYVLKPSILGAITETIDLMKNIERKGRNVIISSAFESSIGRSALVFLASQLNNDKAHGLGVSNIFEKDIAEDEYPIVDGKINFDERRYPPKFNTINK